MPVFARLLYFCLCLPLTGCATEFGSFKGSVKVEWMRNEKSTDREMRLIEPFIYKDPDGYTWAVPEGAVINGASIPRMLWFLGSPFVGNYREASVVHDYFYHQSQFTRKVVDKMFYLASRAGGVPEGDAGAMYFTLRAKDNLSAAKEQAAEAQAEAQSRMAQESQIERDGGLSNGAAASVEAPVAMMVEMPVFREVTDSDVEETRRWIEENNPSLEEIEARAMQATMQ